MLQTTKNFSKFPPSIKCEGVEFKRAKIIKCEAKENFRVWILFDDGISGEVDLSALAEKGVFREAWSSPEKFQLVQVHPESHTLVWGEGDNEIDLDPYVLREQIEES